MDDKTARYVQLRWSFSPMMLCWTVRVIGDDFTDYRGRQCRYERPVGTFWFSRRSAERYAKWFCENYGLPFVTGTLYPWSSTATAVSEDG